MPTFINKGKFYKVSRKDSIICEINSINNSKSVLAYAKKLKGDLYVISKVKLIKKTNNLKTFAVYGHPRYKTL
jgi:hypothetical protein